MITGKLTPLSTETEKDFFLASSQGEFEQMCSQEVLGLTDKADVQQLFHEDLKDHLQRLDDGTYSTRLPWKPDHPPPPSAFKQTTDYWQAKKYKTEAGEDAAT